jgi:hypothetical protein
VRGDEAAGELADELAGELRRRGLDVPGRVLLDAHRPIAPLLADGAVMLGPFLDALGLRRGASAAELLARPGGLERLITRLQARDGR